MLLATHKPIFTMSQTTLFLADDYLKQLRCHCCGGCVRRPKWPKKKTTTTTKKKDICNISAKNNIKYITFATALSVCVYLYNNTVLLFGKHMCTLVFSERYF